MSINSENFYMSFGELYAAAGRVSETELIREENRVGRPLGVVRLEYKRTLRRVYDENGTAVCDLTAEAPVCISGKIATDSPEVAAMFAPSPVGARAAVISVAYVGEAGTYYVCGTPCGALTLDFTNREPFAVDFSVAALAPERTAV